jgi:hypothetical protein
MKAESIKSQASILTLNPTVKKEEMSQTQEARDAVYTSPAAIVELSEQAREAVVASKALRDPVDGRASRQQSLPEKLLVPPSSKPPSNSVKPGVNPADTLRFAQALWTNRTHYA